jgi:hypothetical protein
MGEEAKQRRFPSAGSSWRHPWQRREVGKWRWRLSLPQPAGGRRKGGRALKTEWTEYCAVKMKGNLDGLLGGLGQILERIRIFF